MFNDKALWSHVSVVLTSVEKTEPKDLYQSTSNLVLNVDLIIIVAMWIAFYPEYIFSIYRLICFLLENLLKSSFADTH